MALSQQNQKNLTPQQAPSSYTRDETYVNSMSNQLAQARADIDFLSAMTGTDL